MKIFWQHVRKYKFIFFLIFAAIIFAQLSEVIVPWFYKGFFDLLASGQTGPSVSGQLVEILISITIVHLCGWAAWRIGFFGLNYLEPRVMADISQTSYKYLLGHSYKFFSNSFSGSLTRKVNRLSRAYEEINDQILFNLIPIIIILCGNLIVLYFRNPVISFTLFVWILFYMAINAGFAFWKQKYDIEKAEKDSEATGVLADGITNSNNIKLFNGHEYENSLYEKVTEELRSLRFFSWNLSQVAESIQVFLMIVIEFVLMYMAIRYWEQGLITVGDFALIQAYLIGSFMRLWNFGRLIRRTFEAIADAREMVEVLELPHEVRDLRRAKDLKVKKGRIEFKKVDFRFNKTRKVLDQMDVDIKPGEKVALVGPSGAGKSTITKLIFRFYDIARGNILIDNQDIARVTQKSLREQIALVPQEPILFHRSLMDNIRYGRLNATDDEVLEASKKAKCHDFIKDLPEGYKTFVGERGVKLSGGERQRVAIARAILKDVPILVLDEATSSLDSESEALIQDSLKELMKGKTTIVVAHRLSTIMMMDRILVIDQGRVVDAGTHKELLRKKGIYKTLWDIQAGGFI